jgi:hypothetical protein
VTAKPSQTGQQWASDVCSTGKRSHFTRRGAKVAVKRLRALGGQSLGCYRCDACGHWHVGHRPKVVTRGVITKEQWRQQHDR